MRKIINGKAYDTDTATLIATWANFENGRDFYYIEKRLYLKPRKKEYFLFLNGGSATIYANPTIKPLSRQQAETWAYNNLDAETAEKAFGILPE